MRAFALLLFFGVVGYIAYQVVVTPQAAVPVQPRGPVKPEPTEAPMEVPDLSRVPIKDGGTLTNARIKIIHPSGIIFVADQGLYKVSFDRLPPNYAAYYGPQAIPDPIEPSPTVTPEDPDITPTPVPKPRPQRTAIEDAQAELAYAQRKAGYENQIKSDQATIDTYYKQSNFNNGSPVTTAQYEVSEADLQATQVALSQLEAAGP
jgi:hypothetical protein